MSIKCSVTVCLIPEAKGGPFILWDNLEQSLKTAAELGYDAIELFPPEPEALDPVAVAKLLSDRGLVVSAVGSGAGWVRHKLSLTHPESAHRQKARDFIKRMMAFASQLNAPVIIGSMQGRWGEGVSKAQALDFLRESLIELGEEASRIGHPLLYEPLNRYETNLINTIGDSVEFLNGLKTSGIKILADLFHMNIEERNIANAILEGGKFIGHIHFADSNRRPAGLGHMDFGPIATAIKDIHYQGFLAAEAFPYPDSYAAAKQTVDEFRKLFPANS